MTNYKYIKTCNKKELATLLTLFTASVLESVTQATPPFDVIQAEIEELQEWLDEELDLDLLTNSEYLN